MKEKVEAALNEIRPMLQRDGGDVELVDISGRCGQGPAAGGLCRLPHVADDAQERDRAGIEGTHSRGDRRGAGLTNFHVRSCPASYEALGEIHYTWMASEVMNENLKGRYDR